MNIMDEFPSIGRWCLMFAFVITEYWIVWLVNIQAQFVSSFEKTQRWYKENVNEHCKEQPSFKVYDQDWLQWQNIKTIPPLQKLDDQRFKVISLSWNKSMLWPFNQDSKLHEDPSCVSYFLVGILPCINHPRKDLWTTPTY
jgi:hypothetical protein